MKMTKLIQRSSNGKIAVSGHELYKFLNIRSHFRDWIHSMISEYGFVKKIDYIVSLKNQRNSKGGRPKKEYIFSIEAAKEICMVQRNKRGREIRRYFIDVQKAYKKQNTINLPHTPQQVTHWLAMNTDHLNKVTAKNTKDIGYLKKNMPLNHTEKYRLKNAEHKAVIDQLGGYKSNAYNIYSGKAFRQGWHDFKDHFQLSRYDDLPNSEFDAGMTFLKSWHLHGNLLESVEVAKHQIGLEI